MQVQARIDADTLISVALCLWVNIFMRNLLLRQQIKCKKNNSGWWSNFCLSKHSWHNGGRDFVDDVICDLSPIYKICIFGVYVSFPNLSSLLATSCDLFARTITIILPHTYRLDLKIPCHYSMNWLPSPRGTKMSRKSKQTWLYDCWHCVCCFTYHQRSHFHFYYYRLQRVPLSDSLHVYVMRC